MPPMALSGDPRSRTTPGPAGPPMPPEDWPAQATRSIVRTVDSVRDKTTGPAVNAARYLIFGTTIALLAVPVFIVLLIFAGRVTENLLELLGLEEPMWLVYLIYGTLFTAAGLVLWRKAHDVTDDPA